LGCDKSSSKSPLKNLHALGLGKEEKILLIPAMFLVSMSTEQFICFTRSNNEKIPGFITEFL
jgi:hypothetical protein